jgi:hypothetical protein
MKQVIILIAVTVILILSGIWEIKYFDESSQYVLSDVGYIKNAVANNNFKLAKAHIAELNKTWDDVKNVWSMFIEHQEIDNIEEAMMKFKSYVETENKEESIVYAESLDNLYRHVSDREDIDPSNVF